MRGRRSAIEKRDDSFRLIQPQCVEQRPANSPVYDQVISAFKNRAGATGLWSDDTIDYAVVIPQMAKALLHGGNHWCVVAVSGRIVRIIVVGIGVRVTAQIRVRVVSPGCTVAPVRIRPTRVIAVLRVRSTAIVVAGATVIGVSATYFCFVAARDRECAVTNRIAAGHRAAIAGMMVE